jgi:NAD(P)-dependent dehydrogenase (short-subunit alcohol dehydrogenase family)
MPASKPCDPPSRTFKLPEPVLSRKTPHPLACRAVDTAVVTGAGRGIGRAVARLLSARGYAVLVTDLNEDAARETAEMLGEHVWHLGQDVRDPDRHREVAAAAAERGPLKVWVNNAGILRTAKAWEHSDDEARLMVEANFFGVLWGSRAAVEAMRALGGDIVNLASMSSFGPVPGLAVYGATKHAVLGFTMSLQGDLDDARIPIRTHAICPDAVDTGMVRERAAEDDAAIIFSTPRMLQPEEVAERIVSVIGECRPVAVIPASRGVLVRSMALFPRLNLRLLPMFKKAGQKKRSKAAAPR